MKWHDNLIKACNRLRNQNIDVRLQALSELSGQFKWPILESWLAELTKDVAEAATQAVEITRERLERLLLFDDEQLISGEAAWILGEAALKESIKPLLTLVELPTAHCIVRAHALEALGKIALCHNSNELRKHLLSKIQNTDLQSHENEYVCAAYKVAYGMLAGPSTHPHIPPGWLALVRTTARTLRAGDWTNLIWENSERLGAGRWHFDCSSHASEALASVAKLHAEDIQEQIDIAHIIKGSRSQKKETLNFTNYGHLVTEVVRSWNTRYYVNQDLLSRLPELPGILCAFTSNIDAIYHLRPRTPQDKTPQMLIDTIIDEIAKETAQKENLTSENARNNIISNILTRYKAIVADPIKRLTSVASKEDVIVAILTSFRIDAGKPLVKGYDLLTWIDKVFAPKNEILGGSPSFIANLLTRLALTRQEQVGVRIYTPYRSERQATLFDPRIQQLSIPNSTIDDTKYAWESGNPEHPTKINFPIEHGVLSIKIGDQVITSETSDRVIFKAESYYDKDGNPRPFMPLFISEDSGRPLLDTQNTRELAKDEAILNEIARNYPILILNGPHYIPEYKPNEASKLEKLMLGQLLLLRNDGVTIHCEFTGSTAMKDILYLNTVIKETVESMGMSEEELHQIVRNLGFSPSRYDGVYGLYEEGKSLAEHLRLKRLYVHTHDVDITIRKITSISDSKRILEREIEAILFAKKVVTEHMKTSLERRAFETRMLTPQSRLLKQQAFQKMFEFLEQLADLEIKSSLFERLKFIREVALNGYYLPEEKSGYALVFAPIKWLYGDAAEKATTTSVGDVTSAANYWVSLDL